MNNLDTSEFAWEFKVFPFPIIIDYPCLPDSQRFSVLKKLFHILSFKFFWTIYEIR